jgi:hypothetical protein
MRRGTFKGGVVSVVAAVLLSATVSVSAGGTSPSNSPSPSKAFCKPKLLVDYWAPLRRMPPVRHVPADGRVPFGPAGLRLRSEFEVFTGPASVGLFLRNKGGRKSGRESVWVVNSTLSAVRKGGAVTDVVGERSQGLSRIIKGVTDAVVIGAFHVSRRPGFYRLDLEFSNVSGRKVRYAEYFRVLPRRVDLRLGLMRASVKPGESLIWRVENFGTVSVFFGLDRTVERYEGTGWTLSPVFPLGAPAVGFSMGPGTVSECHSIQVPTTAQPGRYRLSKSVSAKERDYLVSTEFLIE